MKCLIKQYDDIISNIRKLEDIKLEITNKIVNYIFPQGKYKGQTIKEVIKFDFSYCRYWIMANLPSDVVNLFDISKLPMICNNIRDCEINAERYAKEQEYEDKCSEWCEKNNVDYDLDYAIRHNPQLRDFGM